MARVMPGTGKVKERRMVDGKVVATRAESLKEKDSVKRQMVERKVGVKTRGRGAHRQECGQEGKEET